MATPISPNKSKKKQRTDPSKKFVPASKAKGPFKACFYGRPKKGKTQLACSSNLKTLVIDCNEHGAETVADRDNVTYYFLSSWKEENDLYWWAKTANHDIELFVIDTISGLAKLCMKHVMKEAARDSGADPSMPQKQHWGKMSQLMTEFITDWRNLPYNIIFLAQERKWVKEDDESSDEDAVIIEVTPSLNAAPLEVLQAAVGTIGRIYVKDVEKDGKTKQEYRLLLGPHPIYSAGTRVKGVPRVMRNPTLQKILDIRDAKGEHKPGRATHGLEA